MSIEIKDVRLLLPAFISFEENGKEQSIFAYIDKHEVVIPDMSGIDDVAAFKKAFIDFYNKRTPVMKTPSIPKDTIKKMTGE